MKQPKANKSSKQTVQSESGAQDALPSPKTPRSAPACGPLTAEQYRMAASMAAFWHCDPEKAEQFEKLAQAAEERERSGG